MQGELSESIVGRFFRLRIMRIVIAFDVLILIIFLFFVLMRKPKDVEFLINVAPVDAKITINDVQVENNESYFYHSGKYNIKISRDGLKEKNFTIEAKSRDVINMSVYLGGDDFSFYDNRGNIESFYKLREIASGESNRLYDDDKSAEAFVEKTWRAYSLVTDKLPITKTFRKDGSSEYDGEITIKKSASSDCIGLLCLEVISDNVSNAESVARDVLSNLGYNIEDYEIAYKEF